MHTVVDLLFTAKQTHNEEHRIEHKLKSDVISISFSVNK